MKGRGPRRREAGPYALEQELSRGAMGVVYRARHRELADRVVALKVMRPVVAREPESVRRFEREAEALARVSHPSVVRVHETGRLPDGRPYLTMDLVAGRDLEEALADDGPLDVGRAAALLAPVARAVAHLHGRGIIHRDLKLGNVLVDAEGRPRIADFGIAYLDDRATRLTAPGELVGTPHYLAPEVVEGRPGALSDPRLDVYALGVMLFRLVSAAYPFPGATPAEVFAHALRGGATLPPDLGRDGRAVIEKALARDPEERYPGGEVLAADLEALAAGAPVSARPLGRLGRLGRTLRRRRRPLAALGGALLLAVAVAAAALAATSDEGGAEAVAVGQRLEAVGRRLAALRGDLAAGPEPERLAVARRELRRVEAELTAGRRAGVPADDVASVEAAAAALEAQAARAEARLALARARADGPLEPAAVAELVDAFAAAPTAGETTACAYDRAWVLARAGRLAAARDALAGAGGGLAPEAAAGDAAAWLARPAGRGARLLAWIELRLGDVDRARAALDAAAAPASIRALVDLAAAATAADPERRAQLRREADEAVRRAPGAAPHERLARLLAAADADAPDRGELLEAARALATADGAPPDVRGRARLCEGELLLALGRGATAARAFARADALLGAEPAPAAAVALWEGGPRALAAPDTACALGAARACALGLDGEAALAAARRARRAAESDAPPLAGAALLLEAEALELAGDAGGARSALDAAGGLLSADQLEGAWAVRARRARRSGDIEAEGPRRPDRARETTAVGQAELAAGLGPADAAPAHLERARRAFLLAIGWAPERAPAWAGLARVRAERGDAEGALVAGALAGDGPDGRLARGLARAAAGDVEAAAAALSAAVDLRAGAAAPERELERVLDVLADLEAAAAALEAAAAPEAALPFAVRAADLAEASGLPTEERLARLDALLTLAKAAGPEAHAGLIAALQGERLDALNADHRRALHLQALLLDRWRDERRDEATEALLALWEVAPLHPRGPWWRYVLQGEFGGAEGTIDDLALAFEVGPLRPLDYFNWQRVHPLAEATRAMLDRESIADFMDDPALDPALPFTSDPDLRVALVGIYALETVAPIAAPDRERALAAAWRFFARRPAEPAAVLALARLLIAAGEPAEALELLPLARALPLPLGEEPAAGAFAVVSLYEALAAAALEDWPAARAALDQALVEARRHESPYGGPRPLGRRVQDDPLFRERADAPGLRPAIAEAARRLEAARSKGERR